MLMIAGGRELMFGENQLSEKSIKSLKIEHNEFIDYEIFKEVYLKMLTAK
jgi:hypothetical protein